MNVFREVCETIFDLKIVVKNLENFEKSTIFFGEIEKTKFFQKWLETPPRWYRSTIYSNAMYSKAAYLTAPAPFGPWKIPAWSDDTKQSSASTICSGVWDALKLRTDAKSWVPYILLLVSRTRYRSQIRAKSICDAPRVCSLSAPNPRPVSFSLRQRHRRKSGLAQRILNNAK